MANTSSWDEKAFGKRLQVLYYLFHNYRQYVCMSPWTDGSIDKL